MPKINKIILPLLFLTFGQSLNSAESNSTNMPELESYDIFCNVKLEKYQKASKSNFDLTDDKDIKDSEDIIYSIDDLIFKLKNQNLDIKINAEKVFQARQKIKVSIGRLIPSLNFGTILAAMKVDFFDIAVSLIGFAYPSNWFNWAESKLFFEAERRGHASLIANEVNTMYALYYEISYIKYLKIIYEKILIDFERLIEISEKRLEYGEDKIETLLKAKNVRLLLEQDLRQISNTLENLIFEIGFALDEPVHLWNNIEIKKAKLPKLLSKENLNPDDFFAEVESSSFELKEFFYLIKASKYSILTRSFDFLSPQGDSNAAFGFGYFSNISIGKSQQSILHLQREQILNRTQLAVYKSVENYNLAVDSYREINQGSKRAKLISKFLDRQISVGGSFDMEELIESIQNILSYNSQLLFLQHQALISIGVLDRLRLKGKHYKDLLSLSPSKRSKKIGLRKKMENFRIKEDLKKGKLILED